MRTLVCGGRNYNDRRTLNKTLGRLREERGITHLIAGGAPGADTMAEEWAKTRRVPYTIYPADWRTSGRAAGPIRNQRMLDEGKPELVVAFPGARGTAHMVGISRAAGIEVIVIGPPL